LDLVGVSGTNEYNVNPLALVSTVAPPIVVVFRAVPEAVATGGGELAPCYRDPEQRQRRNS
jgi:hypothetical protein